MDEDRALFAGYLVAGLGPLGTTAMLSPFRAQPFIVAIELLALVVVVATAAALAGPRLGAAAALMAALSFDFLFIAPYEILKFSGHESWPVALLLVIGVAFLVNAGSPGRSAAVARPDSSIDDSARRAAPSHHIERVLQLVDEGTDPQDLIAAVQIELTTLLMARSCSFESGEGPVRGLTIEHDGRVSESVAGAERPVTTVELPVGTGSHRVGRFVLEPTPGVPMSFDRRLVAVILTDHLAAAITSRQQKHAGPTRASEVPWSPF